MPFIPHDDDTRNRMLEAVHAPDLATLFDEIPDTLRIDSLQEIPNGMSEMAMRAHAETLSRNNINGTCFIGAGCYEHHIPAAVWDITTRGEFLTAYTPYQAEASQGTLQLLYEFQTMIAELTGMEVANASLYDGASALAEAILMSMRINPRGEHGKILLAGTIHPAYRETVAAILGTRHIELVTLPFDPKTGITDLSACHAHSPESITALVIQQPNFFGCLEAVDALCDWAHENTITTIASVNPISLALLKPPGQWGQHGVDIVCGEGQALGCPMASGGPFFGFFSTRMRHVRQMPGRLAGQTVDSSGKIGYTLTLQAREQHIRRKKATSNICTNQGLLVTAASIYMSIMGSQGMHQTALACHRNTLQLVQALSDCTGVTPQFSAPFFHEAVLHFQQPLDKIMPRLHAAGIHGGYALSSDYPRLDNCLLICATEMRTEADISHYATTLHTILQGTLC